MKYIKSGSVFLIFIMGSGCLKLFFDWNHKDITFGNMNNPETVCVFQNGDALIGGDYADYNDPEYFEKRAGMIYRYSASNESVRITYQDYGNIIKLACKGQIAYAIRSNPKKGGLESHFYILRSTNGGKSWQQQAETSESITTNILILSKNEAWFQGARLLVRTTNGGTGFQQILKLNESMGYNVRLGQDYRRIYIAGRKLLYTENNGKSWNEAKTNASDYYEVQNGYVLAKVDSAVTLGKIENDEIEWIHTFEGNCRPYRLIVIGDTIRFLASPVLDLKKRKLGFLDTGDGTLLFESGDGGKSWSRSTLNSYAGGWTTDIAGKEAGFSLAPFGGASTPD